MQSETVSEAVHYRTYKQFRFHALGTNLGHAPRPVLRVQIVNHVKSFRFGQIDGVFSFLSQQPP